MKSNPGGQAVRWPEDPSHKIQCTIATDTFVEDQIRRNVKQQFDLVTTSAYLLVRGRH